MKILGIGIDIINIKRVEKSLNKNNSRLKNKIFSSKEIEYCKKKKKNTFSCYAKRFAAKEAFSKAIGTGIKSDINFKNIEIINNNLGKPFILLKGKTKTFLKKKIKNKKYSINLSISDDFPWAQAIVIVTYN
jgi:holo-[acyl-carrier protein] synthase